MKAAGGIGSGEPPLIGITGPRLHAAEIKTTPSILLHTWVDSHYVFYPQAVAGAGGVPVHLPREADAGALVKRLDALLVAGGQDIDPRRYGSEPSAASTRIDPGRDRFELELIEAALDRGLPILGVCRGAQLLNVARGGTLVEDLVPVADLLNHGQVIYPPEATVHRVEFRPGSLCHRIYGPERAVNSFHHQSIGELGAGIAISSQAEDETIESIELEGGEEVIGVQWHPEMLAEPDPIFAWLVARAGASESLGKSLP